MRYFHCSFEIQSKNTAKYSIRKPYQKNLTLRAILQKLIFYFFSIPNYFFENFVSGPNLQCKTRNKGFAEVHILA